ncbi:sigma-54-dependent transcriptional regulator [Permianibacter aggregans]|uniref:DNA-binding NtrC family response regulator n=1 Tax=Permianibacter aggregans TaxID=1510150 RepID=A0A4V3D7K2_9GAMM|nr:sigma-54 dependent transcriptional regulator [Permianibacter aggregans]QGX41110.1 sigma-54-dependent Fis family transcriptional regulator [Permianibacter aggregans]TDQ48177.1 DNA-binding NtrC family response regulator [Permianibacter aggregans]
MPTILIIDDNESVSMALDVLLSLHDIESISATTPAAGLQALQDHSIDLIIQDMNFSADTTSGDEGRELFRSIRASFPDMPIILLTAWTHLETAVELIKAGAADYLAKPWDDHRLLATVENLLELSQSTRELTERNRADRRRQHELRTRFDLRGFVFADPTTERVLTLATQIAKADVPVLITGPNGAGKERIAEVIQANSSVKSGPFISINCGALPNELIEAELFGAEAGAYTGANKAREGKFAAADGGTLFLDEIGNLPLSGQIKLLRVLETGRFARLGSNREQQVKVRIISATNADLPQMIQAGQFREDLYYRLNAIEVYLPPLAERPGDILPLAENFLPNGRRFDDSARKALLKHTWPGNVRELKNSIQRACLLNPEQPISAADLGLSALNAAVRSSDNEPDKTTIEQALAQANGVVSRAASSLGLSRQALYRRMERFDIQRD